MRYWWRTSFFLTLIWWGLISAIQVNKAPPLPALYFRGDEQRVMRVDLGGTQQIQQTSFNVPNLHHISPNGQYWLEFSNAPLTLIIKSHDSNTPLITYHDDRASQFVSARWSPDGAGIAIAARSNINGFFYYLRLDGTVSDLDLPNRRQMLVQSIAWSPDSQRIAYTYTQGLRVHDMVQNSGTLISNTNGNSRYDTPMWSPDGSSILFLEQGANYRICLKSLNADGTNVATLSCGYSNIGPGIVNPQWSSDGSQIVFALAPNPQVSPTIYVIPIDGSKPKRLINTFKLYGNPHWSPDTSTIAYTQYTLSGTFTSSLALLDPQRRIEINLLQDMGAGAMWYPHTTH